MSNEKSLVLACPKCKQATRYEEKNIYRPFCSRRCKDSDTIAWTDEEYRVAGPLAEAEEILAALGEEDSE